MGVSPPSRERSRDALMTGSHEASSPGWGLEDQMVQRNRCSEWGGRRPPFRLECEALIWAGVRRGLRGGAAVKGNHRKGSR